MSDIERANIEARIDEEVARDLLGAVGRRVFEDLLGRFEQSVDEGVAEIEQMAHEARWRDCAARLHRMAGGAEQFGMVAMAARARELDHQTHDGSAWSILAPELAALKHGADDDLKTLRALASLLAPQ
ncbi:Hpt domain-containing protein [Magnetofaba australis]|nr:Hpt domain-containing protein [Magnetofaba australis]